jgi:hypothetical protein
MTKERRRTQRLPAKLFIEFYPVRGSGDMKGRGVVVDVSHLGLAVETEADLNFDDVYDCHVEMPFALRAKVVRRYSTGQVRKYGLEIVDQGFLDKFILKRILKGKKNTKKV